MSSRPRVTSRRRRSVSSTSQRRPDPRDQLRVSTVSTVDTPALIGPAKPNGVVVDPKRTPNLFTEEHVEDLGGLFYEFDVRGGLWTKVSLVKFFPDAKSQYEVHFECTSQPNKRVPFYKLKTRLGPTYLTLAIMDGLRDATLEALKIPGLREMRIRHTVDAKADPDALVVVTPGHVAPGSGYVHWAVTFATTKVRLALLGQLAQQLEPHTQFLAFSRADDNGLLPLQYAVRDANAEALQVCIEVHKKQIKRGTEIPVSGSLMTLALEGTVERRGVPSVLSQLLQFDHVVRPADLTQILSKGWVQSYLATKVEPVFDHLTKTLNGEMVRHLLETVQNPDAETLKVALGTAFRNALNYRLPRHPDRRDVSRLVQEKAHLESLSSAWKYFLRLHPGRDRTVHLLKSVFHFPNSTAADIQRLLQAPEIDFKKLRDEAGTFDLLSVPAGSRNPDASELLQTWVLQGVRLLSHHQYYELEQLTKKNHYGRVSPVGCERMLRVLSCLSMVDTYDDSKTEEYRAAVSVGLRRSHPAFHPDRGLAKSLFGRDWSTYVPAPKLDAMVIEVVRSWSTPLFLRCIQKLLADIDRVNAAYDSQQVRHLNERVGKIHRNFKKWFVERRDSAALPDTTTIPSNVLLERFGTHCRTLEEVSATAKAYITVYRRMRGHPDPDVVQEAVALLVGVAHAILAYEPKTPEEKKERRRQMLWLWGLEPENEDINNLAKMIVQGGAGGPPKPLLDYFP